MMIAFPVVPMNLNRSFLRLSLAAAIAATLLLAPALRAQDSVTIPKSKLEELERKAAELERLQRELNKSTADNKALEKAKTEAEAKAAAEKKAADQAREAAARAEADTKAATAKAQAEATARAKADEETRAAVARANAAATNEPPTYVASPMDTLPPLAPDTVVSSMDLLSHFMQNEAAARARYGAKKQRITVEGEITGFVRQPFLRPYAVLLKSGNPNKDLAVWFVPTDKFKAVYTKDRGKRLVGLTKEREAEVTLYRAGQTLKATASCGKLDEDGLALEDPTVLSVVSP